MPEVHLVVIVNKKECCEVRAEPGHEVLHRPSGAYCPMEALLLYQLPLKFRVPAHSVLPG